MDSIISRLYDTRVCSPAQNYCRNAAVMEEAADHIIALEAENARLVDLLGELRKTAALLQQNAEGCAAGHYMHDFETQGLPGWLADTAAVIQKTSAALSAVKEG